MHFEENFLKLSFILELSTSLKQAEFSCERSYKQIKGLLFSGPSIRQQAIVFIMKISCHSYTKLIFTRKALHLASLSKRGSKQLRNCQLKPLGLTFWLFTQRVLLFFCILVPRPCDVLVWVLAVTDIITASRLRQVPECVSSKE